MHRSVRETTHSLLFFLAQAILCGVLTGPSAAQHRSTALDPQDEKAQTLLDESIELTRLVDLCAQRLHLNIQYDANVLQGKPTLRLSAGLSDPELWALTNRLLAGYGLASVQVAGEQAITIVRLEEAPALARLETQGLEEARAGFVKVMRPLTHRSDEGIVAAVKETLSKEAGHVSALEGGRLLVISDLRPRVQVALDLIERLDRPATERQQAEARLEEVLLRHTRAGALAALIEKAASERATITGIPLRGKAFASPSDDRLILLAPPEEVPLWHELIERLDQAEAPDTVRYTPGPFPLEEVKKLVEEVLQAPRPSGPPSGEGGQAHVIADRLTHSLRVTATAGQHERVSALMADLARVPREDPVIEEIQARFVEPTALVALVERVAATRATVTGEAPRGKVLCSPQGTRVLVVAPREEVGFFRELIAQLDSEDQLETVTYAPRPFAAAELARLVEEMARAGAPPAARDRVAVITDELTGTLIVTATPAQQARIRELLERLEASVTPSDRPLRSYAIRNRPVAGLARLLEELVGAGVLGGDERQHSAEPNGAPQTSVRSLSPSGEDQRRPAGSGQATSGPAATSPRRSPAGLSLAADEATNTLIAAGESRTLDRLERLIRELDVREAQVLVEVLVVTLSQSQTLDLGMEIQRRTRDGETLFLFTSLFGLGSPSLPEGAGLSTPTVTGFSGVVLDPGQFSIVLSAFSALNEGRSLSIPKMLVNNNQQATLNSVLQSPFSSTYVSNTVSTTSFGGTQDAGTTVTVRPQIAEGDHLVVDYAVSLSAFVGQALDPNLPPPRQQNHLQSVATVPDGYTVALGGLEIERDAEVVSKVPLLGDIPWLGALFQSRSTTKSRSRFFVFIRSSVLRHETFQDLKYLSDREAETAGIDDGWPVVEPRVIR